MMCVTHAQCSSRCALSSYTHTHTRTSVHPVSVYQLPSFHRSQVRTSQASETLVTMESTPLCATLQLARERDLNESVSISMSVCVSWDGRVSPHAKRVLSHSPQPSLLHHSHTLSVPVSCSLASVSLFLHAYPALSQAHTPVQDLLLRVAELHHQRSEALNEWYRPLPP